MDKKYKFLLLRICDVIMVCFLFFPAMIIYWRGIWDLWGVYVFPDQHPKQEVALLCISSSTILSYFSLPLLKLKMKRCKNRILYALIMRSYMYVYAAFMMSFWRAWWTFYYYYLPKDFSPWIVCITYLLLILFRATRNCVMPPMYVCLDTSDSFLLVKTRFDTKVQY